MTVTDVVTLQQAKDFLNITSTSSDSELSFFVSAASQMWANRGGPVGSQTFDEWYDGGEPFIVVRSTPLISVELVTVSLGAFTYTLQEHATGTSGYAWSYTVDKRTGTFIRRSAGVAIPFENGYRNVHIQYTSGYGTVPDDVQLAVLLLIKHMWTTQRGIGKRPAMGGAEDDVRSATYVWPNKVEEILANYKIPGIA